MCRIKNDLLVGKISIMVKHFLIITCMSLLLGCTESGQNTPKPDDITNGNYCSSAGPRGATIQGGIVSAGNSQICLVPQRWFEYSNK